MAENPSAEGLCTVMVQDRSAEGFPRAARL